MRKPNIVLEDELDAHLKGLDGIETVEAPRKAGEDRWPSREPEREDDRSLPQGQITMRGNQYIIDRFRKLCKSDRRHYLEMLEILMREHEDRHS